MNKVLNIVAVLAVFFLAFSCTEKEPQAENPPQQETPVEPEQPEDPSDNENPSDTEVPGEPGDSLITQGPDDLETFEIRTAEDLVALATSVNAGTSKVKTAMLMNDIDMASVASWTPIGYAKCPVGGGRC